MVDITERQIFLTRHGESLDNIVERIGGDAEVKYKVANWALDGVGFELTAGLLIAVRPWTQIWRRSITVHQTSTSSICRGSRSST